MFDFVYKPATFKIAFAVMPPTQKKPLAARLCEIPVAIYTNIRFKIKQLLLSTTKQTNTWKEEVWKKAALSLDAAAL